MSKKISVVIKDPGRRPRHVFISDTPENLQRTVGGYIEVVPTYVDGIVAVVNEEGKLQGLPPCMILGRDVLVGTVIFCGVDGEEFADLPVDFQTFKALFPESLIEA